MSRVGKQPIAVPAGAEVRVDGDRIVVKGPKGELAIAKPAGISVSVDAGVVSVARLDDTAQNRAFHGTIRALINNMLAGVTKGYVKELEIQGVGFRASMSGSELTMLVGFSHPVVYTVPEGVKVTVTDNVNIKVEGIDKQLVGQVAARIRAFRPPEPYKGKGVRYKDERVRRKAGKAVA